MKTLKSFADLPVTPDMVLREAEKALMDKFIQKRSRTMWQLHHTLAGMGALGAALRSTATVAVLTTLMKGTWVPKSWA